MSILPLKADIRQRGLHVRLVPLADMRLRYWVLGTHDALRIAARSPGGKEHPKLATLYERFRLVRKRLAKLKIAGDDALKDGRVMLAPAGEDDATSDPN
jgi:hypothetical protein